jgi:hypothetical protein
LGSSYEGSIGLESKVAVNRINISKRTNPCPEDKQKYIEEAFRHFDMIG